MSKEIKAVIFDLDGTLLNTIDDIADANNLMLSGNGFPTHSLDKYIQWIGNGAKLLVERSLPHEYIKDLSKYVRQYEELYESNCCGKSKLYPGVGQVLSHLSKRGVIIAINTNKPQNLTDLVHKCYLNKWPFAKIIGKSESFPHKPDPAGALHIIERFHWNASNVLFVGDSDVDMLTAQAAGMIPLGVAWGYGNPEKVVDKSSVVQNAHQIIEFIKEINS